MSQPLDRTHQCPPRGEIDTEAGEFWVNSPFEMPQLGHNLSAYERNCLFLNINGRQFANASYVSTTDLDSDSRSAIPADFTGDGVPDLLVASVGGGPLRLFANRIASGNHRVRIELRGVTSNRSALGARVVLRCGDRQITRDHFAPNGFMGQAPAELNVGLGSATRIDELSIRWPSGKSQAWTDVPVDKRLRFVEDQSDYEADAL